MSFSALKRDCPTCQGERNDCRQSNRGIVFCFSHNPAPPGWQFIGESRIGQSMYANRDRLNAEFDFEARRQEREHRKQQEQSQRAESMPVSLRDRHYRKLSNLLSLSPGETENLSQRGFSPERAKALGYRSVTPWHQLHYNLPNTLPGVASSGKSLITPEPGFLVPIPDAEGNIQAYQLRSTLLDTSAKYRWLTSKTKNQPNGATPHLPSGELPIGVFYPSELRRTEIIGLAEGFLKPQIAADRQGIVFIGAAGAQFGSSPTETQNAVVAVQAKLGSDAQLVLFADAGSVRNANVMNAYRGLFKLFPDLQVAWYGQVEKSAGDIDEIRSETPYQMISFAEFETIAQSYEPQNLSVAERYKAEIAQIQVESNALSPQPDLEMNQPFLPQDLYLPQFKVGLIDSITGSGKTTMLQKKAEETRNKGGGVIWLGHMNAHLEQASAETGIPHVHEFDRRDRFNLNNGGTDFELTACVHSVLKIEPEAIPPSSLLVIDEVEAVVKTLCYQGLGTQQAEIVAHFQKIIQQVLSTGGHVIGAQNRITNITYDFLKEISAADIHLVVNRYQGQPVEIDFYETGTLPGFVESVLLQKIEEGKRLEISTTSQAFGERLEALLARKYPHLNVIRYDQKTKHLPGCKDFARNAQSFLEARRPDILIYTPCAGFGVNIHGACLFHERIAILNSGELDSAVQLPARERDSLPLTIYTVPNANYSTELLGCDPRRIARGLATNARHTAKISGVEHDLYNSEPDDILSAQERKKLPECWTGDNLSAMIGQYFSQFEARRNYSLLHLGQQLKAYYEDRNNIVTVHQGHQASVDFRQAWNAVKKEVELRAGIEFAKSSTQFKDRTAAQLVLASGKSTWSERVAAKKYLTQDRFPGVNFEDLDFVMETVIKNREKFLRTTELLFFCQHPEIAAKLDNANYRARLKDTFVCRHRLTHFRLKADLFSQLGLDGLIEHIAPQELREQFTNANRQERKSWGFKKHIKDRLREFALSDASLQIQHIKEVALKEKSRIYQLFRINLKPEQSATAIANKLLKLFGYELVTFEKLGTGSQRQHTYILQPIGTETYRQQLYESLEAKYRKQSSDYVQNLQDQKNTLLQKLDVNPEIHAPQALERNPPSINALDNHRFTAGQRVRWQGMAGEWVLKMVGTTLALLTKPEGGREWSAQLTDLEDAA